VEGRHPGSRIPAPLRRGLLLFVLLLIIEYLVIPELVGTC
jgi:hypothetical protein